MLNCLHLYSRSCLDCTVTMSQQGKTADFTAYVYEEDLLKIQKLVQPYPDIETGGDLFGLWQGEKTVIIQRFIGPGKDCERTAASFHQDVDYLHRVGSLITTEEGLCNVGEWHSHHQIGMPEPSVADRRTVFSNMPNLGLERFVLFIATIEKTGKHGKKRSKDVELDEIKLHPYLFRNSPRDVLRGVIKIIPGKNPHHINTKTENEITKGAEKLKNGKKRASNSSEEDFAMKGNGKTKQDRRADQDRHKGRSRDSSRSEAQRRESARKENQSPNPNNFPPSSQNFASQGTGHSIQDYMPATSSAPTSSLHQTWDNSLKSQPNTTSTMPSQPASTPPPLGTSGIAGARQERGPSTSGYYSPEQQKKPSRDQDPREKHTKQVAGPVGITMTGDGFF